MKIIRHPNVIENPIREVSVIESLADSCASKIAKAVVEFQRLTGIPVEKINIISKNKNAKHVIDRLPTDVTIKTIKVDVIDETVSY